MPSVPPNYIIGSDVMFPSWPCLTSKVPRNIAHCFANGDFKLLDRSLNWSDLDYIEILGLRDFMARINNAYVNQVRAIAVCLDDTYRMNEAGAPGEVWEQFALHLSRNAEEAVFKALIDVVQREGPHPNISRPPVLGLLSPTAVANTTEPEFAA